MSGDELKLVDEGRRGQITACNQRKEENVDTATKRNRTASHSVSWLSGLSATTIDSMRV